ncbi:hypothetical protein HUJ05_003385 [Dendroctonus ponderosae]|nr:hypothetical protein HUJ05_003385 [Dendroctonus ponderosae]
MTRYIKSFLRVNDSIMLIRISRHPFDINWIQICAATSESSQDDMDAFYNDTELIKAHTVWPTHGSNYIRDDYIRGSLLKTAEKPKNKTEVVTIRPSMYLEVSQPVSLFMF